MNEQEVDKLIEANLDLSFEYFDKVPDEGSSKDLDRELYCIDDREYVISITPLYVTEVEYHPLTVRDVAELFNTIEENIDISRLNEQISKGNKMIREAQIILDNLK